MKNRYLQVTFRQGQPLAAYLYLPRKPGDKSHHTSVAAPGLVVDYTEDSRAIGIEITAPSKISLGEINRVLRGLEMPLLDPSELAPLEAARREGSMERSDRERPIELPKPHRRSLMGRLAGEGRIEDFADYRDSNTIGEMLAEEHRPQR